MSRRVEADGRFSGGPGALLKDMVYAIKPDSIMVSGDATVLNGMDSIVLDSFDLLSVTTEEYKPQLCYSGAGWL